MGLPRPIAGLASLSTPAIAPRAHANALRRCNCVNTSAVRIERDRSALPAVANRARLFPSPHSLCSAGRASRLSRAAVVAKAASHSYDYDLVIIGCGVGGHGAALHAVEQVCFLDGGLGSVFEQARALERAY